MRHHWEALKQLISQLGRIFNAFNVKDVRPSDRAVQHLKADQLMFHHA